MTRQLMEILQSLFRDRKLLLVRFVVTSLGRAITSMAVIFFMREFLASAIAEPTRFTAWSTEIIGPKAALWLSAGLMLVTYLAGALFYFDNHVIVQRIIKVIELGVMERVIRHLLKLSVPFADTQSHGDIIQTVRTDVTQLRIVVQATSRMVLEGAVVVGLAMVAIYVSPGLAAWSLLILPVVSLPIIYVSQRLRLRSYKVRKTGYVLFDMVLEILRGMRIIKAYQGEAMQTHKGLEKGHAFFDELIDVAHLQALARVGMESVAGLSIVAVVLVGGFQVMDGSLDWPSLLAFVMAIRVMHTPLNLMHQQYLEIHTYHASLARIIDFLQTEPVIQERNDAQEMRFPPQEIHFENVGFSYGSTNVLKGITFSVRAGETIGIVGPSGAGKSTLLNLIVRLYDPSSGTVRFDEHNLRQLRLADIYGQVAIVAQEPFLFSTTIRENILCGRPSASEEELEQAAIAAHIHDEIVRFPDGYETLVGVGGRGLSRGQAQRINVARAFIKNAPILLLDEATSSLDTVTEAYMQDAIDHLLESRTSFVVAHRLSTVRQANRLIVLEHGECVGYGSHEELLRDCPLYCRLWRTQLGASEKDPLLDRS
ncbi:MAG: ABC transporter ATP-binding protein [Planctomycetales bacterium]|nr:ABC transporter ATP-binding protein [Planctomycetales bacterium]